MKRNGIFWLVLITVMSVGVYSWFAAAELPLLRRFGLSAMTGIISPIFLALFGAGIVFLVMLWRFTFGFFGDVPDLQGIDLLADNQRLSLDGKSLSQANGRSGTDFVEHDPTYARLIERLKARHDDRAATVGASGIQSV